MFQWCRYVNYSPLCCAGVEQSLIQQTSQLNTAEELRVGNEDRLGELSAGISGLLEELERAKQAAALVRTSVATSIARLHRLL